MKVITSIITLVFMLFSSMAHTAPYQRNKAVPVEKVEFGKVESVRQINEQELIKDKSAGWHHFGGALIGGVIGNQFGDGSGQVAATILGSLIGTSIASNRTPRYITKTISLVELMILTEQGDRVMVVQDLDTRMRFTTNQNVRIIYLQTGSVRVDTAY